MDRYTVKSVAIASVLIWVQRLHRPRSVCLRDLSRPSCRRCRSHLSWLVRLACRHVPFPAHYSRADPKVVWSLRSEVGSCRVSSPSLRLRRPAAEIHLVRVNGGAPLLTGAVLCRRAVHDDVAAPNPVHLGLRGARVEPLAWLLTSRAPVAPAICCHVSIPPRVVKKSLIGDIRLSARPARECRPGCLRDRRQSAPGTCARSDIPTPSAPAIRSIRSTTE